MKESKYIYSNGSFKKSDFELSNDVNPNELLVRPLRMLICASDLHHMKAHADIDLTLGHEYVARVEKAGSECSLKTGDLVTSTACLHCGECEQCKLGMTNYCENREWLGFNDKGALSTAFKIKEHQVVKLPEGLALKEAVIYEVASIGYEAVRLLLEISNDKISNKQTKVAITGAGPVGLFCALAAKKKNLDVTVIEKIPARIKRAAELGFNCLPLQTILMDRSLQHQYDMIIDASGDADGKGALSFVPHLGKLRFNLVIVGKYLKEPGLELTKLNNFGATMKFMRGTPISSLQAVVDEWAEDISSWSQKIITSEYDFSEIEKAYSDVLDLNSSCKLMIKVQD
ncbi:MAG: FAD-binding protein [Deltaproteobacteria bacterium]|nr:MAG: FAD-binding protein [Deltaproteobacteria bacterium]